MESQAAPTSPFANGFQMPHASRAPHQFLGNDSQNPSPSLPSFGFTEDFDDFQFEDVGPAGHDGKRRRIAKACDLCRKKKIKCDGVLPCKNCANVKADCAFTHVEKKRNPPKGAKYIEGLENRLARMENLLRKSGVLDIDEGEEPDLASLEKKMADRQNDLEKGNLSPTTASDSHALSSGSPVPQVESPSIQSQTKSPEAANPEGVEEISDRMCTLLSNTDGDTRYVGSSSGFSIFSPKGVEWVNEKTGDTSFQDMINRASDHDIKWAYWKPEIFGDLFARRTFQPLPPYEEAHSLLRDFFENFNCMFPLFHEPTFMLLVDRQYSRHPYEGSGWWASLNCALAIAHRLRVMSNLVPQEEDRKGWGYLKNAMGVLTELTMRNTDLLSVQALLGMALFLLGTPNPQPSYFLVAAALRLANTIGLHKRGSGFNLNSMEIEQRSRVFWIAYLLDKDLCLRSGRPPAQDDDDMNVDLPSEDPADNVGNVPLIDGKSKVNLFRIMIEFAILQGKVYKQLYSTKASRQTDGVLLNTIGELDQELEAWKDRIPIDLRPEHEIRTSHPPLVLHVAVLHFAYYNCLTTIHRMSIHHGYWTNRLSSYALQGLNARALNPRVFSSAALCVTAARASIQLIKYIPQGDFACVWLILYYPVSALVTLFANILQNPQDARARSDVKLMNQVVNFLSLLSLTEEQGGVKRMLSISAEFERIARCVLDKSEKSGRNKRKNSSKPSGPPSTKAAVSQAAPPNATRTPEYPRNLAPNTMNLSPHINYPQPSLSPNTNSNLTPNSEYSTKHQNGHSHLNSSIDPLMSRSPIDPIDQPSLNPEAGGPTPDNHIYPPSLSHFPTDNPTSPLNMGAFQQPFVPPDMWNMNMSFEWDWDVQGLAAGAGGVGGGGVGGGGADMQGDILAEDGDRRGGKE